MTDGNLRKIFQQYLPEAHWQAVESFSTGQGMPDAEYCFPGGVTGWVEFKATAGWAVDISPHQISWHERRVRMGGRTFIAVRRQVASGPRKGPASDELWLFRGSSARILSYEGLRGDKINSFILNIWDKGPAKWPWVAIKKRLIS